MEQSALLRSLHIDAGTLKRRGGYESFNQLKCACYGLQKKKDDPFRYRR